MAHHSTWPALELHVWVAVCSQTQRAAAGDAGDAKTDEEEEEEEGAASAAGGLRRGPGQPQTRRAAPRRPDVAPAPYPGPSDEMSSGASVPAGCLAASSLPRLRLASWTLGLHLTSPRPALPPP